MCMNMGIPWYCYFMIAMSGKPQGHSPNVPEALCIALRETISYADLHIPRIFFDTYHHIYMNRMQFSI